MQMVPAKRWFQQKITECVGRVLGLIRVLAWSDKKGRESLIRFCSSEKFVYNCVSTNNYYRECTSQPKTQNNNK